MTGHRWRCGFALLLLLAACGRQDPEGEQREARQRIAVMAPAAAETLEALGIAERIVAVGDFVEVAGGESLPRLGSYDLPNAERLVELRVDLLLTAASEAGRSEHARLAALGIRVVPLDTSTYAGTLAAMREVGKETGREREAEALLRSIAARVAAVRERVASSGRPRVLVVVGRDPLFVAGPGSHLDELIGIAGGENVAGDALGAYPMVALEAMLERRPERILDSADNRSTGPFGAVAGDWERWPFLPAVRDRRVYRIEPSRLLVPGPRLGEMAERMGRFVHPEIFGEPVASDFAPPPAGGQE